MSALHIPSRRFAVSAGFVTCRRFAAAALDFALWGLLIFFETPGLGASRARAEPGCRAMLSDGCRPLSDALPRCDETCRSGLCVEDRCVDPASCPIPCDTIPTRCPRLRVGNHELEGRRTDLGVASLCSYAVPGCLREALSPGVASDIATSCFRDTSFGMASFLEGDCDRDGIVNAVEGEEQICEPQRYAVPAPNTTVGTCVPMVSDCAGGCARSSLPHGGSVCRSANVGGYACDSREDCPSSPTAPVVACIERNDVVDSSEYDGLCWYAPICGPPERCFDFRVTDLSRWIEAAFDAGDCDGDGIPNARDMDVCHADEPHASDAGALDAATGADLDAAPIDDDAGNDEDDRARSDAATRLEGPPPVGGFGGSGCVCRAFSRRFVGGSDILGLVVVGLLWTRRLARRLR